MSSSAHATAFGFVEQLARDLKDDRLELPAFPDAVLRIQHALQSPDTGVSDIVTIVQSDAALAARILKTANSAALRRSDKEITDLRSAVARMGLSMVRTTAIAFAMRQLRLKDTYSPAGRVEIEGIWHDSIKIAAVCAVLAKHYTRLSSDQALLAGLLHVLGRLYVVMRAEERVKEKPFERIDVREIAAGWHAAICTAIVSSWGLPEALQHAVEKQDEVDLELEGDVTLTDVLIAAKALVAASDPAELAGKCPAIARLSAVRGGNALRALELYQDEIDALRTSLAE
ncbi:MAG TPA: HDOD domain-containing protein [Gammaproteobacteria bacterium]